MIGGGGLHCVGGDKRFKLACADNTFLFAYPLEASEHIARILLGESVAQFFRRGGNSINGGIGIKGNIVIFRCLFGPGGFILRGLLHNGMNIRVNPADIDGSFHAEGFALEGYKLGNLVDFKLSFTVNHGFYSVRARLEAFKSGGGFHIESSRRFNINGNIYLLLDKPYEGGKIRGEHGACVIA